MDITPSFIGQVRNAFQKYSGMSDINDWQAAFECTSEGVNMYIALVSLLLLKLEKDGVIAKFSHRLPDMSKYYNSTGKALEVEMQPPVICTAVYTILKENGWIFPSGLNFVPSDEFNEWYGCYADGPEEFWSTEFADLENELIIKLPDYNEFIDESIPEEEYIRNIRDEHDDENYEPTELELSLEKIRHGDWYMTILCYYNPKWREALRKFEYIKASGYDDEILAEQMHDIDVKVQAFESCTQYGNLDTITRSNGDRVYINANYAWYDCNDGSEQFFYNPLYYIPLEAVLDAPKLNKEIEEICMRLDEIMRKEGLEYIDATNALANKVATIPSSVEML